MSKTIAVSVESSKPVTVSSLIRFLKFSEECLTRCHLDPVEIKSISVDGKKLAFELEADQELKK